MDWAKDLGTGETSGKIHSETGYPMDEWGRLLDPWDDESLGVLLPFARKGMVLANLTNPYGFLMYVVGTSDDFYCFDYKFIQGLRDMSVSYLIMEATINSETGCFIQSGGYDVIPVREYKYGIANGYVDQALDWLWGEGVDKPLRHNKSGWNQDPYYFARCVDLDVYSELGGLPNLRKHYGFTDRMLRFGGKKIEAFRRSIWESQQGLGGRGGSGR